MILDEYITDYVQHDTTAVESTTSMQSKKPLEEWSTSDVITFLEKIGVPYRIRKKFDKFNGALLLADLFLKEPANGADVINWAQGLGITDRVHKSLFAALVYDAYKRQHSQGVLLHR